MPFEYAPHDAQDLPVVPEHCKAATPGFDERLYQCLRYAGKDGWCWQHHPDRVKARQEASYQKYKQRQANTPLSRCQKELEKVTAQRDLLLAACEEIMLHDDGIPAWSYIYDMCEAAIAAVRGEQGEDGAQGS